MHDSPPLRFAKLVEFGDSRFPIQRPMSNKPRRTALFLSLLMAVPAFGQSPTTADYSLNNGSFWNFGIYRQRAVPEADLADSTRLDQLIRDGKLYLSLADALALALENNLDIAVARYSPLEAAADLLRAKAGSQLRGVQTQISTLSTGQSATGGGGGGGGGGFTTSARGQASGVTQGASQTAQSQGNAASFFGTQTINLDPTLSTSVNMFRTSNPQIQSFTAGTDTIVTDGVSTNTSFSQGFVTGTTFNLGMSTFRQNNNVPRNLFNPTNQVDLSASISQRLTQGFGRAVNNRNIRVARNNLEIEDLNFEQQVISTVNGVESLYWDLVAFRELAAARRLDVELSEQLERDTAKQAELGLQAKIEVTRVKAQSATFRQQLAEAERSVREQQEILKNALTKHGPTSATLFDVEIVPVDRVVIPGVEPIRPISDLVREALSARPDLAVSRMSLRNTDINLRGIKNALKPTLDMTAFARNNGLAGTVNPDVINLPGQPPPNPFFSGGIGSAFGQAFRRNFPDYGLVFNLNIPLKNRQAQADMSSNLLARRRSDISIRQAENSIKLEVARALANLEQARKNYEIAAESLELYEQMLDAEKKRFSLGSSTIFQIIQAQRDLATSRTGFVNATTGYKSARMEMDRVLGKTLEANSISVDEAYRGEVSKPIDPIPPAAVRQP